MYYPARMLRAAFIFFSHVFLLSLLFVLLTFYIAEPTCLFLYLPRHFINLACELAFNFYCLLEACKPTRYGVIQNIIKGKEGKLRFVGKVQITLKLTVGVWNLRSLCQLQIEMSSTKLNVCVEHLGMENSP